MRATLKPKVHSPHHQDEQVTLLNRCGRDQVRVELRNGRIFSANTWRLYSVDGKRRLTDEELRALPWKGAGKDPAGQTELGIAS